MEMILVELPKSFPRRRGLGFLGAHAPGPQGGQITPRRTIGAGVPTGGVVSPSLHQVAVTPAVSAARAPTFIHKPRRSPRRAPLSTASNAITLAQPQGSLMPDEPDFAPFTAALEKAGELGVLVPSQVAAYQAQAEESDLSQLQALTGQLNLMIAAAPTPTSVGLNAFGLRRIRRRGLGVGTAAGEQVGSLITAAAPATGPAAPIVAAVGVLTSLISSFIGGGCGPACIQAAQAEQIYEYAAQCLDAVASAGMIGQAALQGGLETFLSAGTQHMQALNPQDSQSAAGLTNMTNAINSDLKAVGNYPANAPDALNLSTVQSVFPSTAGWYAASATAGAQLAMAYLQSIASTSTGIAASAATGTVSVLGATFSMTDLLIGLGVVAVGFYLWE